MEEEVKVSHEERDSAYQRNKRLSQLNKEAIDMSKNLIDENKSIKENLDRVTEQLERDRRILSSYRKAYGTLETIDTYVHNVLSPYWQSTAKEIGDGLEYCRESLSILKSIPSNASFDEVKKIMDEKTFLYL